jgi:hypothetical protein
MSGIAVVIEELLMATVLAKKTSLPRKSKTDWALMALSVLLGCAGVFLSILALERFFEERYPLDVASLLSAVIVLAVAASIALATQHCRHRKPPVSNTNQQELESSLHALLESICVELESPVRENPKTAVLLAAIAGFVTAQRKI